MGFVAPDDITFRVLDWMHRGYQKQKRNDSRDQWWQAAQIMTEVHNGALSICHSWGHRKDEKGVQPKDINPLEKANRSRPAVDRGTEDAFAWAAEREREKAATNGKPK